MVHFTVEEVLNIMNKKWNIRNMCVIAHVDHGKTTLTDSLIAAAGIIQSEGIRFLDTGGQEQDRGITIKSTGISLHFKLPKELPLPKNAEGRDFVINLIDSPGHVDFSSEVTAALRVTDGALVVVDMIEGVCVQTETVLRQALTERIRPVLVINKVDRGILELQLTAEDMYRSFVKVIESTNAIIATYCDEALGDCELNPEEGTVAFTSGYQGWGFTLAKFGQMYASKFQIDPQKLVRRLWGDNYYDPETKKWITRNVSESGKPLPRAFCQFILDPIIRLFNAAMTQKDQLDKYLKTINVTLTSEEQTLTGKQLIKLIMKRWLPAHETLLEIICLRLPSPAHAQQYRCETLYTGPMDDATAQAVRACDPDGPLCMYVSKLVPNNESTRFFAFGRVFSGTVSSGTKVHVLGGMKDTGGKSDNGKAIQRVVVMMGRRFEYVESVTCGNICSLVGIDQFLTKSATVTTDPESFPIRPMKFSVSPVARVSVNCKNPSDLPKLVDNLKRLVRLDSLVNATVDESGQHVISGAGELHLEVCLSELKSMMKGAEVVVSPPIVSLRETVTGESTQVCLAKTSNKHNRLFTVACPLGEGVVDAIETGMLTPDDDPKTRARRLNEQFGWDVTDARKIWAFGPNTNGPNMLVDCTRGVQNMNEIKDLVVAGFQWVTSEGALAGENLRDVRFNVMDVMIHSDKAHRGGAQIIPAARRVLYASQLSAKPRMMEPIFLAEIQVPAMELGGVYGVLNRRRGVIIEEMSYFGNPLKTVKAYLPVMESFGFTTDLRQATSGKAFPQCVFDHWEVVSSDPNEPGRAKEMVESIRKRKGLDLSVPTFDQYLDKL